MLSRESDSGTPGPSLSPFSPKQFTEWIRPHWSAMTGLAMRLVPASEVDDVVQEALGSAWTQRFRFDPNRGSARSWLLALTADQARRASRRRPRIPVPVANVDLGDTVEVDGDVDLRRAVAALSGRPRLAVELFYYLGVPVAEVAAAMGCAEGTVKSTLSDARRRLRATLEGHPS